MSEVSGSNRVWVPTVDINKSDELPPDQTVPILDITNWVSPKVDSGAKLARDVDVISTEGKSKVDVKKLTVAEVKAFKYPDKILEKGQNFKLARSMLTLKAYVTALENKGISVTDNDLQSFSKKLSGADNDEKKIENWAKKVCGKGVELEDVKFDAKEQFKMSLPKTTTREFTIDGSEFTESDERIISNTFSSQFIKSRDKGGKFVQQTQYLDKYPDSSKISAEKGELEKSGGLTNGCIHVLEHNGEREVLVRSGIPSVHGNTSEGSETFAAAQAASKVVFGIQATLKNNPEALKNAQETGNVVFCEQSLLTYKGKEKGMIEQGMKAFQDVEDNVKIKIVNDIDPGDGPVLIDEGGQMVALVYDESGVARDKAKLINIKTIFLNNGINEEVGKKSKVKDEEINSAGMGKLLKEAKDLRTTLSGKGQTRLNDAIAEYERHIQNRKKENISGDDVTADHYATQNLLKAMGAARGICCKSGKDRTGMVVSAFLAQGAKLKASILKKLRASLKIGNSLHIAARNHKAYVYSLNFYQSIFKLPKDYEIPSSLRKWLWTKLAT